MVDRLTPEKRSKNMSAIRSKDTKPEIYFRKLLFSHGYRYRLNVKYVFGRPDLYLKKYNTAIFVHGCYWHRHQGCKYAYTPKSNVAFWRNKFNANISRDCIVKQELTKKKIKWLIIWECTIKKMRQSNTLATEIMNKIIRFLESDTINMEL